MRVTTSPATTSFGRTSAASPLGSTSLTYKPFTPSRCLSVMSCAVSSPSVSPSRALVVFTVSGLSFGATVSPSFRFRSGRSAKATFTARRSSFPSTSRQKAMLTVWPTAVPATLAIKSCESCTCCPLNSTMTSLTRNPAFAAGVGWPSRSCCTSATIAPFASARE